MAINIGVASRCKYHTNFGSLKAGTVDWSDLVGIKSDVVEWCTVTVTPGSLGFDPWASLSGSIRIEVKLYALSGLSMVDRSRT